MHFTRTPARTLVFSIAATALTLCTITQLSGVAASALLPRDGDDISIFICISVDPEYTSASKGGTHAT